IGDLSPMTALDTARPIRDIRDGMYPVGVRSPDPKLNAHSKTGVLMYDRPFLLQFQDIVIQRPPRLATLEQLSGL
ncbi:hypothetical protein CONPUDRAFT_38185, partial [Coniophora puteana RWD-64-598 SS2]